MRLGLLLLLAVVAAGCGGGSSSSTLGSVAKNDLAIMVLPAAELGDLAEGLHVDPQSGFEDSTDVAQDTMSPDDTAQDIDDAGFQFGYQLNYTNAGTSDDPVQVTSQVSLFESPEDADAFVDETIGGANDLEGAEVGPGAKVTAVTMEEADGPGDSAWEGSATATAGTTEVSSTVVAFTIDQVAASVSMTKLGDPAPTEDVQDLAQKLASRIEAVAARTVTDTPVPVPTETTTTTTTPQQDPALKRMVLALKDLPFGVSVKNEGYVTGGDDVSFQRDFALGNTKVGKSELIGLQSNAERMDSAAEAAVAVNAVSGAVKGPAGRQLFAESFAKGAGFSAESLRINELPGEGIGDEATVLHATFETGVGPFEAILVFIAEGRAAGQVYAAGAKGKVAADDILGLARTMARKMRVAEEK